MPHQVDVVLRHRLQVGIAPYLTIGRGVVDAAHRAPIGGIDGLTAEREVEHVLVIDVPHGIELRVDAPFVPFCRVILLGCHGGFKSQRLVYLFAQTYVAIHDALVVVNA